MQSSLYPNLDVLEPMKIAKPKSEEALAQYLAGQDYFGEIKKDGALYQLVRGKGDDIHLFSRTVSKKTGFFVDKIDNVPHIKEWGLTLPENTTLLGEIYYPNKTSKDVTKIMGCIADKAISRQEETGLIHYYMFDVLKWDGLSFETETNFSRIQLLHDLLDNKIPNSFYEILEIAEYFITDKGNILDKVFCDGEEGMVFKQVNGLYQPGKRNQSMIKVKTEDSVDLIVTGFLEPERVYTGKELDHWTYWEGDTPVTKPYYFKWKIGVTVGALDTNGNIVHVANVSSGVNDNLKEQFAVNPNKYLYTVAQIQCMSVDKKERTLRHPRLIGFHADKNPTECTLLSLGM